MLTPKTMRLLGSTNKDVDKDKDGENVPKLKSLEVVLVHCNLVLQFLLLKFDLHTKLVKHLTLKIISI